MDNHLDELIKEIYSIIYSKEKFQVKELALVLSKIFEIFESMINIDSKFFFPNFKIDLLEFSKIDVKIDFKNKNENAPELNLKIKEKIDSMSDFIEFFNSILSKSLEDQDNFKTTFEKLYQESSLSKNCIIQNSITKLALKFVPVSKYMAFSKLSQSSSFSEEFIEKLANFQKNFEIFSKYLLNFNPIITPML